MVDQVRFIDVTWEFAQAEGEGFTSIDDWRAGHREYWTGEGIAVDDDSEFAYVAMGETLKVAQVEIATQKVKAFAGGGKKVDWYREGAVFLVDRQNAAGSWSRPGRGARAGGGDVEESPSELRELEILHGVERHPHQKPQGVPLRGHEGTHEHRSRHVVGPRGARRREQGQGQQGRRQDARRAARQTDLFVAARMAHMTLD